MRWERHQEREERMKRPAFRGRGRVCAFWFLFLRNDDAKPARASGGRGRGDGTIVTCRVDGWAALTGYFH